MGVCQVGETRLGDGGLVGKDAQGTCLCHSPAQGSPSPASHFLACFPSHRGFTEMQNSSGWGVSLVVVCAARIQMPRILVTSLLTAFFWNFCTVAWPVRSVEAPCSLPQAFAYQARPIHRSWYTVRHRRGSSVHLLRGQSW